MVIRISSGRMAELTAKGLGYVIPPLRDRGTKYG